MNVKNIKSFIEFYESLGISTFLTQSQRFSSSLIPPKIQKKEVHLEQKEYTNDRIKKLNILKNKIEKSESVSEILLQILFFQMAITTQKL